MEVLEPRTIILRLIWRSGRGLGEGEEIAQRRAECQALAERHNSASPAKLLGSLGPRAEQTVGHFQ